MLVFYDSFVIAVIPTTAASGLSKIAIVGIVLGACLGAAFISATVTVFIMKKLPRNQKGSKRRLCKSSYFLTN